MSGAKQHSYPAISQAEVAGAFKRSSPRDFLELRDLSLDGKWIVVSAANSGIGREACLRFARWGANLILACRQPRSSTTQAHPRDVAEECVQQARNAGHGSSIIEWWELDCGKISSVEAFAARWLETGRRLDVLCNNAGIAASPGGSKRYMTEDGFEIIHQVNFLSHVLLTLRLLPSLEKAASPRVIYTNSVMHFRGQYDTANCNGEKGPAGIEGVQFYSNNKLYLQIWTSELQRRLRLRKQYKHIIVNGVHPGLVSSGIWAASRDGWIPWFTALAARTVVSFIGINSEQGSVPLLYLATSDDTEVMDGGNYFNRVWRDKAMPHANHDGCRAEVWNLVDNELGLTSKGLISNL